MAKDADVERIDKLEAELKSLRASYEDFIAKFATYYTSDGRPSLMIVTRLYKHGACDGVVIDHGSSQQAFGVSELPIGKIPGKQCWEPISVPTGLLGQEAVSEREPAAAASKS